MLSRERKEFVDILVRNNSNNKWEEYDINEIYINEKDEYNHKDNNNLTNETINDYNNNSIITYYNRINSFKIIEDDNNKLFILDYIYQLNLQEYLLIQ